MALDMLSRQHLLLNSPAHGQLGGDLYANVHNSQIELAGRRLYNGRYRVSPNSLTIPGTSSFILTQGTIFNQVWLRGSIVVPQNGRAADGWAMKLIDRLELQVTGQSSIQSLQLDGEALFSAVMCMTSSIEKRDTILQCSPGFNLVAGGATQEFAFPLTMFFSTPELRGSFALDSSTLKSQIQINIRWKDSWKVISGSTGNAITAPTAFNSLEMSCTQIEMMDGQLVSTAMSQDEKLVYTIPSLYLQSFSTVQTVTHGSEISIDLSNLPNGKLQAILVSAIPSSWVGASTTLQYCHPFSIDFLSMRLLYNGQVLYQNNSTVEEKLIAALKQDSGAGFGYTIYDTQSVSAASPASVFSCAVHVIPFSNEVSEVLQQRRQENTPTYGGNTLNFYAYPATTRSYITTVSPIVRSSDATPSAVPYTFTFTYVFDALVEVDRQTVSLVI